MSRFHSVLDAVYIGDISASSLLSSFEPSALEDAEALITPENVEMPVEPIDVRFRPGSSLNVAQAIATMEKLRFEYFKATKTWPPNLYLMDAAINCNVAAPRKDTTGPHTANNPDLKEAPEDGIIVYVVNGRVNMSVAAVRRGLVAWEHSLFLLQDVPARIRATEGIKSFSEELSNVSFNMLEIDALRQSDPLIGLVVVVNSKTKKILARAPLATSGHGHSMLMSSAEYCCFESKAVPENFPDPMTVVSGAISPCCAACARAGVCCHRIGVSSGDTDLVIVLQLFRCHTHTNVFSLVHQEALESRQLWKLKFPRDAAQVLVTLKNFAMDTVTNVVFKVHSSPGSPRRAMLTAFTVFIPKNTYWYPQPWYPVTFYNPVVAANAAKWNASLVSPSSWPKHHRLPFENSKRLSSPPVLSCGPYPPRDKKRKSK